jgi:hypothetical protein
LDLCLSSSSLSLHSQLLSELILTESGVGDIRVSLKHLEGLLESVKCGIEGLAFLSDSFRLSQGLREVLVFIDLSVELELKSLLGLLDEEETDGLGDGIADVSHGDLEVGVDSASDLSHEKIRTLAKVVLGRGSIHHALVSGSLTIRVVHLLLLRFLLRNNVSPRLQIVTIISE